MEWTNEKYLHFINDYRSARVLWDTRNPNYKNNSRKRSVVAELARKYEVEESAMKRKIKNLRSAFHREHHRLTNKQRGSDDETRKWFAYDSLKFILDVTRTSRAIKEESSFTADEPPQQDTEEEQDYSDNPQLIELPPLLELPPLPERPSPEQHSKEEDEYDLFGRSMAMQLRKLPELTSLELMQKMQLMVLNARKQMSKEKSRTKKTVKPQASTKRTSSEPSSPGSSASPCYKFEVMSPCETDPSVQGDRSFTYVTTVEHDFPAGGQVSEVTSNVTLDAQRHMKRTHSSVDPLEVKPNKLSNC